MSSRLIGASSNTVWGDLGLGLRVPGVALVCCGVYNTYLFYESGKCFDDGARFRTTEGRLLELHRLKYNYIAVPRYRVVYEYEVDGVKYVSRRATTGSPYRDWMGGMYNDTITEAQYLQSIPVLRIGESCTVTYDTNNPGTHSALAHDANSWEISFMFYFGVFPLLAAGMLKMQANYWKNVVVRKQMRVRFPEWAHEKPRAQAGAIQPKE